MLQRGLHNTQGEAVATVGKSKRIAIQQAERKHLLASLR